MRNGKDYIVFALDVSSAQEAEKYVKLLKGHVGMFKVGLELFIQTGPDIITKIRDISSAGIFLDLKFHDISETVRRVMERVAELGVDLVTVHCASSQKMLEMAVKGGNCRTSVTRHFTYAKDTIQSEYREKSQKREAVSKKQEKNSVHSQNGVGVLGVTVLTDHDASVIKESGFKENYVQDVQALVMKRAQMAYSAGCRGVVCSGQEAEAIKARFGKEFLAVTPGIRPLWSVTQSDDQQRITTPAMAVKAGADLIVVGRPIKTASDPAEAAEKIAQEIDEITG